MKIAANNPLSIEEKQRSAFQLSKQGAINADAMRQLADRLCCAERGEKS